MKINSDAWKTEKWVVHETSHAIIIPGHGIYGGLPIDVAAAIVEQMNIRLAGTQEPSYAEGL